MFSNVARDKTIQIRSDHIVPVEIEKIANLKEDSVLIGNSKFVRVITMGKIAGIEIDSAIGRIRINLESSNQTRLIVDKVFMTSFTRNYGETLKGGDIVSVAGKIRLGEDGTPFINAFAIRNASFEELRAFLIETKLSDLFYTQNCNGVFMPNSNGKEMSTPKTLNIGRTSLGRFPLSMLENCSVKHNSEGLKDLEKDFSRAMTSSSEEDDSFDSIPGIQHNVSNKSAGNEEEDSFDKF